MIANHDSFDIEKNEIAWYVDTNPTAKYNILYIECQPAYKKFLLKNVKNMAYKLPLISAN